MSDIPHDRQELPAFLLSYRRALLGLGVISAVISLLGLASTVYMLEIYDRVLPSKSLPTLAVLTAILLGFLVMQGTLEWIRGRIFLLIGHHLDEQFGGRIYRAILSLPLRLHNHDDGLRPLRDLDQLRNFIASPAPVALFDLPWVPVYVAVAFSFHIWIGSLIGVSALLLVGLTLASELLTKYPAAKANTALSHRNQLSETTRRNAEVIRAMGMAGPLLQQWQKVAGRHRQAQLKASAIAGGLGGVSRMARMTLQSLVLGLGAYLAIGQEVSAGAIIACSVLLARALQPIELLIGHWKSFLQARQSWLSLAHLLALCPIEPAPMALPAPSSSLQADRISLTAPGHNQVLVHNVSFTLESGQILGIVGASGSGKSCLVRALAGVWPLRSGTIRVDDATLDQWSAEALGRHIGYLPQDIELFDGTVAENISRFQTAAPSEQILEAAGLADVHAMILQLPMGYSTRLGENGSALSAGQRQRLGLARALYGRPFMVILDEPNSNLDATGEQALQNAMIALRNRGAVVLVVAHRPSVLACADQILVMADGTMQAYGPKETMVERLIAKPSIAAPHQPAGAPQ